MHKRVVFENRGDDGDEDWVLVCECGWEAPTDGSEDAVRIAHSAHAREAGRANARGLEAAREKVA